MEPAAETAYATRPENGMDARPLQPGTIGHAISELVNALDKLQAVAAHHHDMLDPVLDQSPRISENVHADLMPEAAATCGYAEQLYGLAGRLHDATARLSSTTERLRL